LAGNRALIVSARRVRVEILEPLASSADETVSVQESRRESRRRMLARLDEPDLAPEQTHGHFPRRDFRSRPHGRVKVRPGVAPQGRGARAAREGLHGVRRTFTGWAHRDAAAADHMLRRYCPPTS